MDRETQKITSKDQPNSGTHDRFILTDRDHKWGIPAEAVGGERNLSYTKYDTALPGTVLEAARGLTALYGNGRLNFLSVK